MEQSAKLATPELVLDRPPEAEEDELALARPSRLMNRNFVLMWQGQWVSQLGTQVYSVALLFLIKHATGSATLIGFLTMISAIPGVILSGIGGTVADRHSRRKIIIFSDLLRGILVVLLAGLVYMMPDATTTIIIWLGIISVVMSVTGSFFRPAFSAAIPDLVPPGQVTRAQSLRQMTVDLSVFVGRGLGGVLFRFLGAPLLILVNGLSFLYAATSETFAEVPQVMPERGGSWREEAAAFKQDIIEGVRYVWNAPGLRRLFFFFAIFNFFTMPVILLLSFYVEDFLRLPTDWFGYLLAIFAGGTLLGSLSTGFVRLNGRTRARLMVVFAVTNSLLVGTLGFVNDVATAAALALAIGAMGAFNGVNISAILQMSTPSEIRGRVFGLLNTLSGSLAPLGMGLGGLVFDLTGQSIPLIYGGCGAIMVALSISISLSREFRTFLAYEPKPGPVNGGQ